MFVTSVPARHAYSVTEWFSGMTMVLGNQEDEKQQICFSSS